MLLVEARGDTLFIEYDGPNDPEHIVPLMEQAARQAREGNCTKILADLRGSPGALKLVDRYSLGVLAVDLFRGIHKVAIVTAEDKDNLFGESVAVNRGLPTKITSDMAEARRWLGMDEPSV